MTSPSGARGSRAKRYLLECALLAIGGYASARLAIGLADDSTMQAVLIAVGVVLFGQTGLWMGRRLWPEAAATQPGHLAVRRPPEQPAPPDA